MISDVEIAVIPRPWIIRTWTSTSLERVHKQTAMRDTPGNSGILLSEFAYCVFCLIVESNFMAHKQTKDFWPRSEWKEIKKASRRHHRRSAIILDTVERKVVNDDLNLAIRGELDSGHVDLPPSPEWEKVIPSKGCNLLLFHPN